MKKFLVSLLIVCTLVSCMMVCASAAEPVYEQGSEMATDWPAIYAFTFDPIDITGAVAIKFDFFVETAANLSIDSFELCSYKASDWKEKNFNGNKGFTGLSDGWNVVTLNLAEAGDSNDTNPNDGTTAGFDFTTFQRIRMYNVSGSGSATKVAIKNIVAVKEDGSELKIGAAPAPVTEAPADPVVEPTTFDAAASVAVAAAAAMGIALVASKKRH